jgi:hypothetical protein
MIYSQTIPSHGRQNFLGAVAKQLQRLHATAVANLLDNRLQPPVACNPSTTALQPPVACNRAATALQPLFQQKGHVPSRQ